MDPAGRGNEAGGDSSDTDPMTRPTAVSGKKDCEETIRQVYPYLDGELTVWKRQIIGRHLDECEPCAQGYEFEVELRQVIASRCHDEVPESLRMRIADFLGLSPNE